MHSNAPYVHSVSYGDDENSVTPDYALRINAEFMKFGARGISILYVRVGNRNMRHNNHLGCLVFARVELTQRDDGGGDFVGLPRVTAVWAVNSRTAARPSSPTSRAPLRTHSPEMRRGCFWYPSVL